MWPACNREYGYLSVSSARSIAILATAKFNLIFDIYVYFTMLRWISENVSLKKNSGIHSLLLECQSIKLIGLNTTFGMYNFIYILLFCLIMSENIKNLCN